MNPRSFALRAISRLNSVDASMNQHPPRALRSQRRVPRRSGFPLVFQAPRPATKLRQRRLNTCSAVAPVLSKRSECDGPPVTPSQLADDVFSILNPETADKRIPTRCQKSQLPNAASVNDRCDVFAGWEMVVVNPPKLGANRIIDASTNVSAVLMSPLKSNDNIAPPLPFMVRRTISFWR